MFDTEVLATLGLWGLFLAAFLAGTLVAFGSEAALIAVLLLGVPAATAVGVATVGNTLGSLTVYAIGRAVVGREETRRRILEHRWLDRWRDADPKKLTRAQATIERWGPVALLLSWVPAIGDVLVLAAGLARLRPVRVVVYVATGKAARYAALAWAVVALRQLPAV